MVMRKKYQDETSMHFTGQRHGKNRRNKDLIRAYSSFQKVGHMGGTSYLFLTWFWTPQCKMIWHTQICYIKIKN